MKIMSSYKSNNNTVYSCKYHIVWCTKYRKPLLVKPIDQKLKEILYQIAHETQSSIIEREVMPDQVHVLIEIDPQFGVNKVIKLMEGTSSRATRAAFSGLSKLSALWTNSCFIELVGGAPLAIIKQYIQNQKNV